MTREEKASMPMTLKEKDTGKVWKSDGKFHTMTCDWNCDGDIYTDRVMFLHELDGNGLAEIHEYDFEFFEIIR